MKEHIPSVIPVEGGGWMGSCTCGWTTKPTLKTGAQIEALEHAQIRNAYPVAA